MPLLTSYSRKQAGAASAAIVVVLSGLLSACKIEINVPAGGAIASQSGAHSCDSETSCDIEVNDLFFDETFTGQAEDGLVFTGWKRRDRGLCGGSTEPCTLVTAEFAGSDALLSILESDQRFYLEPLFERAPGPLFNVRYCEVLLATIEGDQLTADVYGTQGINPCPQEQWEQLDAAEIAADYGATRALLNGPRFWVLDLISSSSGEPSDASSVFFGELEMRLLASVQVAASTAGLGGAAYQEARVARDTIFYFFAGRRVYELQDPEGRRYIMQSFSRIVNAKQTLADLATLEDRLALPEGWTFSSHILEERMELPTVDGSATVITDNFANTYQFVP